MLYQLINENQIRQFPLHIEVLGDVYTNELAEEEALKTGEWFELVEDEKPNYDPDTQYLLRKYIQENDAIRLTWLVVEKGEETANV